ncbi:MAG: (d)CMP kinase [Chitinophagales bacterium]|nr:(d)CMP kinase [Chitinophagales bacterium]
MPKNIIITIDGVSSSGKSTLAKQLAALLRYRYIDSGAFYRAVTVFFHANKIDQKHAASVKQALHEIQISFEYDSGKNQSITYLNHRDVESEIRSMKISNLVSEVSTLADVRRFIVAELQSLGDEKGIVMDGRDIGTVVFPKAELKIFMTAEETVRSKRRFSEMKSKGLEVTKNEIKQNLSGRDLLDSKREIAPLKRADDALILDSTHMTEKEQLNFALTHALYIINGKH